MFHIWLRRMWVLFYITAVTALRDLHDGCLRSKEIMDESTDEMIVYRPTLNPSKSRSFPCADDSPTSTSYTRRFIENILPARFRRCLISTRWSTCGETGLGLNSPPVVLGPYIDFSNDLHCILSSVEHRY